MKLAGIIMVCCGFLVVLFPENWPDAMQKVIRYIQLLGNNRETIITIYCIHFQVQSAAQTGESRNQKWPARSKNGAYWLKTTIALGTSAIKYYFTCIFFGKLCTNKNQISLPFSNRAVAVKLFMSW